MGRGDAGRLRAGAQELPLRGRALDLFDEPATAAPPATYTVSELGREVQSLLREAFGSVWVVGEVARYRPSAAGHHYFDLVEKGEGDRIVGTLSAVVWKGEWARVRGVLDRAGERLAEGLAVRCRVALDFYPPGGRLQAQVREIDPAFTLGELERRRRETIAALAAAGLLEANRALPLAELPLRIGLVSSHGSAASHDFLATLRESGFGFRVVFVHAAVQGADAEREIASAIGLLAGADVDLVALVRGGGSRTDLAAFDSRAVAEAVGRSTKPVLTGLGHETDQSVADLAAHRAFKTPTKVAEFLVSRLADAEAAAERGRERLLVAARAPLAEARLRLLDGERRAGAAWRRLERLATRLEALAERARRAAHESVRGSLRRAAELGARLVRSTPRALERFERQRTVAGWRLAGAARARLAAAAARVEGSARLVAGLGLERTLARGFSVTRTAAGRVVRAAGEVRAGERLSTQVAAGRIASRVEEA